MTPFALTCARVLTPDGWRHDTAVVVSDGVIAEVLRTADLAAGVARFDLGDGSLLPGFVDVQVNGGGGVLLNDQPDVEGVEAIAAAHRRFGTTALLPTLISDDLDVVARAIAAVDIAIERGVPGVVGIHLEGPFLNERKRGIHDAGKFRPLDVSAVELLSSLRNGVTLVTLAPELAGEGLVAALAARGVIVSAGHTMAGYEDVESTAKQGLTGVTHLFNAMTQLESRTPGVVGAALDLRLFCGLIVDGQHVHPAALRVARAAIGVNRLLLVTDAMPTVGMAEKRFALAGREIMAGNGACRAVDGTLAGSDLDMATAVRNAVAMMRVDLAEASVMASATPARFLGLHERLGAIAPGLRADLVHLDANMELTAAWLRGRRT